LLPNISLLGSNGDISFFVSGLLGGFDLWMPDDQRGNFVTFVAFFPIPGLILY